MAKPLPATDEVIEHVAAIVAREGEVAAAKTLGVSRQTIARCLARLPLYRDVADRIAERVAASAS